VTVRKLVGPWGVTVPLLLCAGIPSVARAQDVPPPPPPGPRGTGATEKFLDPGDPRFRGASLGDLSDFRLDLATNERVATAVGGVSQPVWLRYEGFELRCDNAVIWGDAERLERTVTRGGTKDVVEAPDVLGGVIHAVYAEGKVFVRRDGHVIHADRVLLDFRRHQAYLVNVLMQGEGKGAHGDHVPLGIRAAVVRGMGRDSYRAEGATFTSCTYAHPHLAFDTSWVTVDFSKKQPEFETGWWPKLRADTWVAKDVPLVPLPKLGGRLGNHPVQTLELSRSNRFGTSVGVGFGGRLDREDGSTWGTWQTVPRYRTRRGAGLGFELDHEGEPRRPGGPRDLFELSGEYQRDRKDEDAFSDRPFDGERGGDSDPDRGVANVRLRHVLDDEHARRMLGDGWRLDAEASWYSDRGYLPEYDSDAALREPQQATYAELSRTWGTQGFALLASRRLVDETSALVDGPRRTRTASPLFDPSQDPFRTDYASSTDYLPSATWHLINHPVLPYERTRLAPVNLSVEASVANVERRYDDFVADRFAAWESTRVLREDVETRVTTPFEVGPVQVTPAFGASVYHVDEANGFLNTGTDAADDDEGRHAVFAGLRVGSEAHRTYGARSDLFQLDGLRHVASLDAQWFDRFQVSDPAGRFQQNDLHDRLFEQNVVSLRFRNRLQTRRDGEVVDWLDYEARLLYYVEASGARPLRRTGLREEFTTPLERLDFPGEDKYLHAARDGSAFHQHRARVEFLPRLWFVGEADYDMQANHLETGAVGARWFLDRRFSVYVGRRTIHEDSAIWTVRGDYRLSDKWAFAGEVQQDTRSHQGLRTRVSLFRRSHDFTIAVEFESERLLEETGFSFMFYPHDWIVKRGDPFSQRRPLDFEALRWYR
jgi:hypothetical protein